MQLAELGALFLTEEAAPLVADSQRVRSLLSLAGLHLFDELRQDFQGISHDTQVCDLKDRCFLVPVDRNDLLSTLHADDVLSSARDSEGEVHVRLDGGAGLADLHGVGHPSRVDHRTRGADGGVADARSKLVEKLEVAGVLKAAAPRNDNGRLLQLGTRRRLLVALEPLGLLELVADRRLDRNDLRLPAARSRLERLRPHEHELRRALERHVYQRGAAEHRVLSGVEVVYDAHVAHESRSGLGAQTTG